MEILVTKRLTLRPPLEVDAEAITEAFQNPNITRNLTNVPNPYGLQDALSWVERSSDAAKAAHFCIYREKLLGVVSISASKDNIYQLGYWLGEDVWGEGYMTEAARAALSYAFRRFSIEEVESGAYEDNRASLAVLDKLGFEDNGKVEVHQNPTRKTETPCPRRVLTRNRFEQFFGSLETDQAA